MSALLDAHIEIARERFLDLMATDREGEPHHWAQIAIIQADVFIEEYAKRTPILPAGTVVMKTKGCGVCFGSGGKANNPCKACGGSGRVQVPA